MSSSCLTSRRNNKEMGKSASVIKGALQKDGGTKLTVEDMVSILAAHDDTGYERCVVCCSHDRAGLWAELQSAVVAAVSPLRHVPLNTRFGTVSMYGIWMGPAGSGLDGTPAGSDLYGSCHLYGTVQ